MTGKQQTPLEKTKEGINLGRLSDKILQDVIERPLRRAARQTRDKVVGRLMEPGAERMFKKPAFFPGDWLLIPLAILLCLGVIGAGIGIFGLPKKAPVVQSGPMPMGEKFEVAPNKETNPDMLPIFDGGLSETKKVFECRDVVSMFITTPGTLVIDNFTKKNIRVETPASFPGLITLECNGKIGLSQTQLMAAPTIPVPTQFATNTPAPTQIPPQTTETQPTPAVVFTQSPDVYGVSKYIKSGNTLGEFGFWQPLSVSGFETYRQNGKVVASGACNVMHTNLFATLSGYTDLILVLDQPGLFENPTVSIAGNDFSVTLAQGCTFSLVTP